MKFILSTQTRVTSKPRRLPKPTLVTIKKKGENPPLHVIQKFSSSDATFFHRFEGLRNVTTVGTNVTIISKT